jgi:hypothetical protein
MESKYLGELMRDTEFVDDTALRKNIEKLHPGKEIIITDIREIEVKEFKGDSIETATMRRRAVYDGYKIETS